MSSGSPSWFEISLLCFLSSNRNLSDFHTHSNVENSSFVGKTSLKTCISHALDRRWNPIARTKALKLIPNQNTLQNVYMKRLTSSPSWVIFTDCFLWEREETMLNTETTSSNICRSKANRSWAIGLAKFCTYSKQPIRYKYMRVSTFTKTMFPNSTWN